MVYVSRNGSNAINGLYVQLQPGYAEEFLPDNDPAVVAFLNPPPTAEQQRVSALKANARRKALVTAIQGSDDAQLITFLTNNITDLPTARTQIINLALLVAAAIRS